MMFSPMCEANLIGTFKIAELLTVYNFAYCQNVRSNITFCHLSYYVGCKAKTKKKLHKIKPQKRNVYYYYNV